MSRRLRGAALQDYVVAQIETRRYFPGDRLPPVLRLARQFQLSYATAYRALDALVREGRLVRSSARLLTVNPQTADYRRPLHLTVLIPPEELVWPVSRYRALLRILQRFAAEWRTELEVTPLAVRAFSAEALARAAAGGGGIVLLGAYDACGEICSPAAVPVAGTGMAGFTGGGGTTVESDPYQAASLAVAFFLERAVRRVTIAGFADPAERRLGRIFECLWHGTGGGCDWDRSSGGRPLPGGGEGLFFTSDRFAEEWLGEADPAGRHLFSVDGESRLRPGGGKTPTVAADLESIGEELFWEITNRAINPDYPVRHLHLAGRLLPPPPAGRVASVSCRLSPRR